MKFISLILTACALVVSAPAVAGAPEFEEEAPWGIRHWNVQFSVYTKHFDPEPEHNNDQNLFAAEAVFNNDWLAGAAVFDNSFGQSSQFVFVGKTWALSDSNRWYAKLVGGLLHGYKEPYDDKIPLNGLGIAPAIIPALGYRYRRVVVEANLAGLAAFAINVGIRF